MSDSVPSATLSPTDTISSGEPGFWWTIGIALVLRIAVLVVFQGNLADDRDAYLALARQVSEGNGFRTSAEAPLTAYRPPLYPLVLALPLKLLPGSICVATVNLLFSLLTVVLVWKLARARWSQTGAAVATLVVAIDPLFLSNVALPMTETMFTGLVVALIFFAVRPELTRTDRIAVGLLFGLSALCRPTIWAFGGIAAAVWLILQIRQRSGTLRTIVSQALSTVLAACVVLAPWVIRNGIVFGTFIPMTTHGGYTLLLANNPVFYQEVVQQGWRTTWEGESLARWQQSLEVEMTAETPPVVGETERDRWMSRQARETIANHPGLFLQSCLVRFLRFWNPVPLNTPERPISRLLGFGIGLFSISLFLGAAGSCLRFFKVRSTHPVDWLPICAWCLILSMTLVHLLYWSNLRMRTPLEPFLALLAIGNFSRFRPSDEPQVAETSQPHEP